MKRFFQMAVLLMVALVWTSPGMAYELSDFSVKGQVTYRGKTMELKTAYAKWRPKENEIFIFLQPYQLDQSDLGSIEKNRSLRYLKKDSPNKDLWSWVPSIWITMEINTEKRVWDEKSLVHGNMSFQSFEKKGTSGTISGSGYHLERDFKTFDLSGTSIGEVVRFSLDSKSEGHKYDIKVSGQARIIDLFEY